MPYERNILDIAQHEHEDDDSRDGDLGEDLGEDGGENREIGDGCVCEGGVLCVQYGELVGDGIVHRRRVEHGANRINNYYRKKRNKRERSLGSIRRPGSTPG